MLAQTERGDGALNSSFRHHVHRLRRCTVLKCPVAEWGRKTPDTTKRNWLLGHYYDRLNSARRDPPLTTLLNPLGRMVTRALTRGSYPVSSRASVPASITLAHAEEELLSLL